MPEKTLFSDSDLRDYLTAARNRSSQMIQNYDPEKFLLTAENDLVEYIVGHCLVEEIYLLRDQRYGLEPEEISKTGYESATVPVFGARAQTVTRWTLVVPVRGDPRLLFQRASTFGSSPPRAYVTGRDLHIYFDTGHSVGAAKNLEGHFDATLDQIERHLQWTNYDIALHNRGIRSEVPDKVRIRRNKHLADKRIRSNLSFPIVKRGDAASYTLPLVRRQLIPSKPLPPTASTDSTFEPEPILEESGYEAALEVLRHGRNALERSPSTTNKLGEEEIRDLLLMLLNGHFEGQAGGELFNGRGKTDILIRVKDRNVFIGECKFWAGPKKFVDGLNQLLSYATWRDTKTALLIFVRQGDPTAISEKAAQAVREHPSFKRPGHHADADRQDFVLHVTNDVNREVKLALMIIVVG